MGFTPQAFVALVKESKITLPDVRRRALMESLRRANDKDEAVDMFLEAASNSPYVSAEKKAHLANALLDGNMSLLIASSFIGAEQLTNDSDEEAFRGMLEMVRLVLTHSRKFQSLPKDRRRCVVLALQQTQTESEILDLVLQQLPTSMSLDRAERQSVATDILDHRYYRLLLPDRLHCDEPLPRIGEEIVTVSKECPICLTDILQCNSYTTTKILQCCGQRFCTDCIAAWSQQSVECPLCRSALPRALPPPMLPFAGTTRRNELPASIPTIDIPPRRRGILFRRRRANNT